MKNKVEDLRDHLFATIEALRDEEKPMELERAAAIAQVAQVIVNSAKVENDRLKLTGKVAGNDFIKTVDEQPKQSLPGQPRLVKGSAQP